MAKLNINSELSKSLNEKDVENLYREYFKKAFPGSEILSPFKTDGILKVVLPDSHFNVLTEFKYDYDFTIPFNVAKALVQAIYYLKRIERSGDFLFLPPVVFVGDMNECFILHSNQLKKYLDRDLNWAIAPSEAASKNYELVAEISNDKDINPYVFDVDANLDFNDVCAKILETKSGEVQKIKLTEFNINRVFDTFVKKILPVKHHLNPNELVSLFLDCVINYDENYVHPKKKDLLCTRKFGELKINGSKTYEAFFTFFDKSLSTSEKERLISVCDRLIEDLTRRIKGEFYTPTEWVNEAHQMISDVFGENWREEYVCWDPAAGTLNLTRDYRFVELYASTLNESDLHMAERYNREGIKFQYDFLNDGIFDGEIDVVKDDKLPQGLKDAILKNKKIIILFNPPYGRANSNEESEARINTISKEATKNKIADMMTKNNFGGASSQLYTQFLYRVLKLSELNDNINIAVYTKSLFLTGSSFKKFRSEFFKKFQFQNGMLFNSSHFSDTSDCWAVNFSIWKNGIENKNSFLHEVKEFDENMNIVTIQIKDIYNLDIQTSASEWLKKGLKEKNIEYPKFSSGLSVKETTYGKGVGEKSLSTLVAHSNNVYRNLNDVFIINGGITANLTTVPIYDSNFLKCMSLFVARKTITQNWINDKDEYLAPDTTHPDYAQWNNDAIVYSLFNTSSNQSSLRQITYKEKLWDIKNEFFWLSKKQIQDLADQSGQDEIYDDAKFSNDRYVYNLLKTTTLSPDAQAVLDKATELLIKSFNMRKELHQAHPEWHLNTWDAGWYQVKLILKEFMKDDLKEFNALYKKFEDRMREGVYKFGFLK